MTVEVAEQKQEEMEIKNQDGKVINQSDYSCQILLEKPLLKQQMINLFQQMLDSFGML